MYSILHLKSAAVPGWMFFIPNVRNPAERKAQLPDLNLMKSFTFIMLLLLICSCESRKVIMPVKTESTISKSYNTSKSKIENFDSGYVDTFSIGATKFRLFSNPDTLGDLELQVMKHGKWQTNLRLPYALNGNNATADINGDGANDFVSSLLRGSRVYLFDTSKQEFHENPISLAFEWSIIDKTQQLYSNNYSSHDYYETNIFKLDGFHQTFYYTAPIEYTIGDGEETATLRLYKVHNNNLADTTFVSQHKFDVLSGNFDYKMFWIDKIKNRSAIDMLAED